MPDVWVAPAPHWCELPAASSDLVNTAYPELSMWRCDVCGRYWWRAVELVDTGGWWWNFERRLRWVRLRWWHFGMRQRVRDVEREADS